MDQKRFDTITRTLATGLSRRGVLRVLGVVGASGLLALVGQTARAADRPHEILQDRSEQRNRKQRNTNQNNQNNNNDKNTNDKNTNQNNDNDTNDGGGSQLGSGQTGQLGSSPDCSTCEESYDGCTEPCDGEAGCLTRCQNNLNRCNAQCPTA